MIVTTTQHPVAAAPARRRGAGLVIGAGFVAGAVLGVIARIWMRLITTDPEFTWSGTIFIVTAFAVFGAAQAGAWAARRGGRRRAGVTAARAAAGFFSLGLFGGAGSIMLPAVAAASLALWRSDWPRWLRAALAVLSVPTAVFVGRDIGRQLGWSFGTIARIVLFVAIYAAVVAALSPTVTPLADGWRVPRPIRALAVVLAAGVAALVALTVVGA